MASFASDGPSVMVGKKNGVVQCWRGIIQTSLLFTVWTIDSSWLYSKAFHRVKETDRIDELLSAVYKYYHYSTVKSGSLDAIQTVLRETCQLETKVNLSVTKAVHTRAQLFKANDVVS